MGQNTSRLTIPTIKSVKSMNSFQEYPGCTLNQIFEAYGYWMNSEFSRRGTLFSHEFEEIFGQLFPDPSLQFQRVQEMNMGACITLDVFYLLILLADASMEQKLKSIYEIHNKDSKVLMRIDAIQGLVYKLLASLKLVMYFTIPSRDEINFFLENSLKQYIERTRFSENFVNGESSSSTAGNAAAGSSGAGVGVAVGGRRESNNSSSTAPNQSSNMNNNSSTTASVLLVQNISLNFIEFWQWCQDVHQISQFLEAIDDICLHVTRSIDRTHKGKQWVLRNSFFSSHSFAMNSSNGSGSVLRSSMQLRSSRHQGMTDNLMDIMQQVVMKVNQMDFFETYLSEKRHPLWQNSITSMVSDAWFQILPVLHSDQKVFTVLEHMILSQQTLVPILHRNNPQSNLNTASSTNAGGSRSNLYSNKNLALTASATGSSHRISNFTPHPPQSNSSTTGISSMRPGSRYSAGINSSNLGGAVGGGGGGGGGGSGGLGYKKVDLLGVIDYGSILTWMIESAPPTVFKELKKQERLIRSKRLSFEFSFHQDSENGSIQLTDTKGNITAIPASASGDKSSPSSRKNSELAIETDNLDNDGDDDLDAQSDEDDEEALEEIRMNDLSLVNRDLDDIKEDDEETEDGKDGEEGGNEDRRASTQSQQSQRSIGGRLPRRGSTNTNANSSSNQSNKPIFAQSRFNRSNNRRVSLKSSSKWQTMGEIVTQSFIEKVFLAKSFPTFHMKFNSSSSSTTAFLHYPLLTTEQSLYDVILFFAKGFRHVPISLEPLSIDKIYHIIHAAEVAQYLYENYQEFFSFSTTSSPSPPNNNNNNSNSNSNAITTKNHPHPTAFPFSTNSTGDIESPNQHANKATANNNNNNNLLHRSVLWTGLMRKPSFVCNPIKKASSPRPAATASTAAIATAVAVTAADEAAATGSNKNNINSTTDRSTQETKIVKYNLGSILHQLLQSNLDSIVITNENNQVIAVVSIAIVEEIWWNWKKRNIPKNLINFLQFSDLIKEYEQGLYAVFDEESGGGGDGYGDSNVSSKPTSATNAQRTSNSNIYRSNTLTTPQLQQPQSFPAQHQQRLSNATPAFTPAKPTTYSTNTEQGTPYPFGFSSTINNANLSSGNTNNTTGGAGTGGNSSKYHHAFFSVFMNSLEACKELLNITIIDFNDFMLSDEERAAQLAALTATTEKTGSPHTRQKNSSQKNNKRDAARVPVNLGVRVGSANNAPSAAEAKPTGDSPTPANNLNETNAAPPSTAPPATATTTTNEGGEESPTKSVKAKKKGKSVKKYGNFTNLAAFQQHLQREKEKEESRVRVWKTRRLEQWFATLKLITPNDTLQSALYVMYETKCNCAHVVSLKGEPIGVITLQDICKYLILQEAKQKIQQLTEHNHHHHHHHHPLHGSHPSPNKSPQRAMANQLKK